MNVKRVVVLAAVSVLLGSFAGGCQSGGVGDPCTPEDEYQPGFPGFSATEVNIESRSFQCETRVCLVYHFRGRVSCPLGQDEATATQAASSPDAVRTSPTACRIPGTSGASAELVNVPVQPQCASRQAANAVYCSCRCGAAEGQSDEGARFCECPEGYTCQGIEELDLGSFASGSSAQLRGKYCVKQNTQFQTGTCTSGATFAQAAQPCDNTGNCGANANP